ncbi:unnamed protein product [Orchesella dallaii]|uniref:Probable arginine--tRNA ligase, mitochondrial n=1 Tax=Orchesella dallaii TaxID=48710 RepID=A0ABP1RER7_9HEXA
MQKVQKLTRHFRTARFSSLNTSPEISQNLISQWVSNGNIPFPYSIQHRVNYSIPNDSTTVRVRIERGRQEETHNLEISSLKGILSKISIPNLSCTNLTRALPSPPPPLVIEYSSPNIAKPLHMGHLRSTLTGKYVSRISKFAGHDIKSITFLGDWGTQFGVLHLGIMNKWDKSIPFKEFLHNLNLHQLLNTYVESSKECEASPETSRTSALAYSAELERNFGEDNDANAVWKHTRNLTVSHLKTCYDKLGIQFDEYEAESMYRMGCEATVQALDVLRKTNLLETREDGSAFIRLSEETIVTVLKRDNSSVYLLRDIACGLSRSHRYPDHSHVYVVDAGQGNHFRNLFKILNTIVDKGNEADPKMPFKKYNHVQFGRVTGMSTRSGDYVLLDDVINEGRKLMHERRLKSRNVRNEHDVDVSEELAISGLIIHALKMRKTKDYAFDWDSALTSSGNSGVALQYSLARVRSLNERVTCGVQLSIEEVLEVLVSHANTHMLQLVVCLLNFEDVFWRSYLTLEPCVLVSYAFTLHDRVSRAYSSVKLLDNDDKNLVAACLWVFNTSNNIMKNTLNIIGMEIINKGF